MATHKYACVEDFEEEGLGLVSGWFKLYYQTGCDEESTLRDSRLAFKRYRLRPRILRDVSKRDLSTTILGTRVTMPIAISPTAFHRAADLEGEKATARAARDCGTLMVQSMNSNTTMADVAAAVPGTPLWMNVYMMKNREITAYFVREAERCGYQGIVLTVDSAKIGNHIKTARKRLNRYDDMTIKLANFDIPEIQETQEHKKLHPTMLCFFTPRVSASVTTKDIRWLKSITKLPIICKGVLTGETARELAEAGVEGIIVSAHGGRQLDYVPAPLDALPEVVEAVRGFPVEVYMDGGVRTGTDVFKALARGARAVFIGRPIIWGLACEGEEGVKQVLEILREEFSLAMALSGCAKLSDIQPSMVIHESYYHSAKL
ncbi:2-Hydroxyacid oxidase 1-like [Diadema antillarum]|uniref:2-Hydroxyacid oxidase 1-like n=1 Tax=Diadema antillarum TaxID=105358 RepID=UPI003A867814